MFWSSFGSFGGSLCVLGVHCFFRFNRYLGRNLGVIEIYLVVLRVTGCF